MRAICDGEVNCALKAVDSAMNSYCSSSRSTIPGKKFFFFDYMNLEDSDTRVF
jgi:hypothetical protein